MITLIRHTRAGVRSVRLGNWGVACAFALGLSVLIAAGADVKAQSKLGNTALILAPQTGGTDHAGSRGSYALTTGTTLASEVMCFFGITSTCTGRAGLMSLKARMSSSS